MMMPSYCDEDNGQVVTKARALELLALMLDKATTEVGNHQAGQSPDDTARFHSASGAEFALIWAMDLMKRTVIDAQATEIKNVYTDAAEALERQAENLRRKARD